MPSSATEQSSSLTGMHHGLSSGADAAPNRFHKLLPHERPASRFACGLEESDEHMRSDSAAARRARASNRPDPIVALLARADRVAALRRAPPLALLSGSARIARWCLRVQPAAPTGLPAPGSPLVHPPRSTRSSAAPPDQGRAGSPDCVGKTAAGDSNREPCIRRPMKVKGLGRTFRGVLSVGWPVSGAEIASCELGSARRGDLGPVFARIWAGVIVAGVVDVESSG